MGIFRRLNGSWTGNSHSCVAGLDDDAVAKTVQWEIRKRVREGALPGRASYDVLPAGPRKFVVVVRPRGIRRRLRFTVHQWDRAEQQLLALLRNFNRYDQRGCVFHFELLIEDAER